MAMKYPLHNAVEKECIETVRALIASGINISMQNRTGSTALHLAAQAGHVEIVRLLLDAGIDASIQNNAGKDALYDPVQKILSYNYLYDKAQKTGKKCNEIQKEYIEIIRLLIPAGVDLLKINKVGSTYLHIMVQVGDTEIVRKLIAAGINVSLKNKYDMTALMCAMNGKMQCEDNKINEIVQLLFIPEQINEPLDAYGSTLLIKAIHTKNIELVRILLERGAVMDPETILHYAAGIGSVEIARYLLEKGAHVDKADRKGRTPLLTAASGGHWDVVDLLLSRGASIHVKDDGGFTLLQCAVANRDVKRAELLIEKGLNIDEFCRAGITPLMRAAQDGDIQMIESLLQRGADVNMRDNEGKSSIFYALDRYVYGYHKNVKVIQLLIAHGVLIDIQTKEKLTPLTYAIQTGPLEHIQLLLDAGARIDLTDCNGHTALYFAIQKNRIDRLTLLFTYGVNMQNERLSLHAAVGADPNIIQLLLDRGACINERDANGCTPLMLAARENRVHTVEFLFASGADAYASDNEGWNALHYAADNDSLDVMRVLLKVGLRINRKDMSSVTALFIAIHLHEKEQVQILLHENKDLLRRCIYSNFRPLAEAESEGDQEIVELLLKYGAKI